MVYCGKPSRACSECRVKRRKCDLSKPSCGQCLRARFICSGYRDQLALAFRDQSLDVAHRAQPSDNLSKRSIPPKSNNLSSVGTRPFQQAAATQDIDKYIDCALHSRITLPIEDQGTPFFLYHYLLNETTLPIGQTDCFAIIYGRASARGYLSSIISAIGIASLSNLKKEPKIMYDANRRYSLALEGVRARLAEPAEAISDQMLVGVMLLTLYETVTCNITHRISSWETHIHGALTLLQLRGMDQLNFKIGRRLFLQLRTEVLISCLERDIPVPQVMLKWMSEAQKFETREEIPSSRLAHIVVNVCALRATTKSRHRSDAVGKTDFSLHVTEILSIDADLAKWSTNLPSLYNYSTTITTDHEDLYLGLQHNYSSLYIAYTWNLYRCARIFLNQILTRLIPLHLPPMSFMPKTAFYGPSLQFSEAVIYEGVTGICFSVPFILGNFQKERNTTSDLRAACALSLLWPLYIAGTACPAQQSLREWAILQLEKIGGTAGIQKAKITAIMLRKMDVPEDSI